MRKASITLSTVDLYDLPAWIEERLDEAGVSRSCKRALLVSRDFSDYEFDETVSRNHGHLLEVFRDTEITGIFRDVVKANEWLGVKTVEPASRSQRPLAAPWTSCVQRLPAWDRLQVDSVAPAPAGAVQE